MGEKDLPVLVRKTRSSETTIPMTETRFYFKAGGALLGRRVREGDASETSHTGNAFALFLSAEWALKVCWAIPPSYASVPYQRVLHLPRVAIEKKDCGREKTDEQDLPPDRQNHSALDSEHQGPLATDIDRGAVLARHGLYVLGQERAR